MKKLITVAAATVAASLALAAPSMADPPTPSTGCGVGFAVSGTPVVGAGIGKQAKALGVNPGDAIQLVHDYNKTLC